MRQMAVVLGTEGRRRSAPAAVPEAGPRLPPVPMRLEPARNRGEGMSGWCIQSAYVAFAGKRGNLEALLGHPGMANMAIQEWPDLSEVVARAGSILDRFPECRVSLACRFLEDLFRQGRSRVTTSQMAALAERRNWLEIQFPRMPRARKPGMYWGDSFWRPHARIPDLLADGEWPRQFASPERLRQECLRALGHYLSWWVLGKGAERLAEGQGSPRMQFRIIDEFDYSTMASVAPLVHFALMHLAMNKDLAEDEEAWGLVKRIALARLRQTPCMLKHHDLFLQRTALRIYGTHEAPETFARRLSRL